MVARSSEAVKRPLVLLFDSIHYCLAAERAFGVRGVWCDVVPVPRDLSFDCGMAVEFRRADLGAVRDMCAGGAVRPKAVYRRTADGHEIADELAREGRPGG